MPGIKHGFMHSICHSPTPKNISCQAVAQLIRAMPRWGLVSVTSKGAFDDPSPRQQLEALDVRRALDNIHDS
jgi:hypothetical protein